MRVIFYDDDEESYSNTQLVKYLRKLPNFRLTYVNKIDTFESSAKDHHFDAFILDIMGPDNIYEFDNPTQKVPCTFVGVELLRRVRAGLYNNRKDVLVIIRSAKTDSQTKAMCQEHNANHIFEIGDNLEILSLFKELINHSG